MMEKILQGALEKVAQLTEPNTDRHFVIKYEITVYGIQVLREAINTDYEIDIAFYYWKDLGVE